jgi:hypothetical protein
VDNDGNKFSVKAARISAIAALTVFSAQATAAPEVYLDETLFLNELAAMGYTVIHEGFEDDTTWGTVRNPAKAPTVSSQGATWSANNLSSEITTGNGPARNGDWGFYSLPHGSYDNPDPGTSCFDPEECGDGFRAIASTGTFIAHGGWIETNTPVAKLGMVKPVIRLAVRTARVMMFWELNPNFSESSTRLDSSGSSTGNWRASWSRQAVATSSTFSRMISISASTTGKRFSATVSRTELPSFSKQVRVAPQPFKNQLVFHFLINEKPVRFYVTFPSAQIIPKQFVVSVQIVEGFTA